MKAPPVSVVIPSHRGGRYLREAVRSVHQQTLEAIEVIVVADGCDEDMADLQTAGVSVIRQRQRGVSIARNVGVAHARSDLIAFLDDDDRMLPNRLKSQYEAMQNPAIALCHTQFQVIDAEGELIRQGGARDSHYSDFLRIDGAVVLSSVMTRKSVFQEVGGFNPLMSMGEDLDFIFKVARESLLCFLPEVLIEYRLHGNNAWANGSSKGADIKLILAQHRAAAEARSEMEHLSDIREGYRHILPTRSYFAHLRAQEALTEHRYGPFVLAAAQALVLAPRATVRVAARKVQRERKASSRE
jgi:glycosyltransferase involved in cell wall biosynthesis